MKKIYVIAGGSCIGCASCAEVCPVHAVKSLDDIYKIDEDKCVGCGRCGKICPKMCIFPEDGDEKQLNKCSYILDKAIKITYNHI